MSTRAKSRLAGLAVVLFTVWPLAQLTLVHTHDISPWKLAGWGMYSVPTRIPYVTIGVARPGERPTRLTRYEPAVAREMQRFLTRRTDLGPLARPHALADRVFETDPRIDRVWINFVELRVDRQSARMRRSELQYPYSRPGG